MYYANYGISKLYYMATFEFAVAFLQDASVTMACKSTYKTPYLSRMARAARIPSQTDVTFTFTESLRIKLVSNPGGRCSPRLLTTHCRGQMWIQ